VTSFPEAVEAVKTVAALKQLAETQQRILDATAARLGDAIGILRDLQDASQKHAQAIEAVARAVQAQNARLAALEQASAPPSNR
jgi:peptidoglycan hydrolase CwlO-like protein